MEKWLVLSIITLVLWGVWGFLLKQASRTLAWHEIFLASASVYAIAVLVILLMGLGAVGRPLRLEGMFIAFLAGIAGIAGYMLLVIALDSGGPASIVIPLTALYPLITVILSTTLLGESLDFRKAAGVLLALIAILLLSLD